MIMEPPYDYAVKIECPDCGKPVKWITRRRGGVERDEYTNGSHPACGEYRHPDRVAIDRAIEKARQRPARRAQPFDGRTARVRGQRVP